MEEHAELVEGLRSKAQYIELKFNLLVEFLPLHPWSRWENWFANSKPDQIEFAYYHFW